MEHPSFDGVALRRSNRTLSAISLFNTSAAPSQLPLGSRSVTTFEIEVHSNRPGIPSEHSDTSMLISLA